MIICGLLLIDGRILQGKNKTEDCSVLQDIGGAALHTRYVASASTNSGDCTSTEGRQTTSTIYGSVATVVPPPPNTKSYAMSTPRDLAIGYPDSAATSDHDLWSSDVMIGAWHLTCLSRRMRAARDDRDSQEN